MAMFIYEPQLMVPIFSNGHEVRTILRTILHYERDPYVRCS